VVDRGIKGLLVPVRGCLLDGLGGSLNPGKSGTGSFGRGSCQGRLRKPLGGPQGVFEGGLGKVEGECDGRVHGAG
jgi:hypothetical protein